MGSSTPLGATRGTRGPGGTTQIFCASTLYGAATLAAAIDAGLFAPASRRLLVVCNNAASPELHPSIDRMPGFEQLRERFDDLVSWNETIAPFHPSGWAPRSDDTPLWERHLRLAWGLGDDSVEVTVESIQVNPALAITEIFTGAPLTVYADGLMSYGPTRSKIDPLIGGRVRRLLHLDLVPGLKPLLLTEFGVEPEIVPTQAFRRVLDSLGDTADDLETPAVPPALVLGQYLSALTILSEKEEERLHVEMVRGAAALGHTHVVFKPHPAAPAVWSRLLEDEAKKAGVELTVIDSPVLAEVLYERMKPALVVGCFSTALLTANAFYDIPVARAGTDVLLERLAPYQNSNRVPVTIVDALVAPLGDDGSFRPDERLGDLIKAVGYAMQSQVYPGLRPAAERYLSNHLDQRTWRYFKRRRLTALGLPGAVPSQLAGIPRNATARRMVRRARKLRRTMLRANPR
ncbi:polysialyltransferase family glycosyltransferase [Streptomyces sp. 150FB]|uniref:polysialyltransferase family glycosyltransferase n=1 Tax=Streptomyces sp. 150FB TaxID=1576605 RepID=UPI0006975E89|nr:polysialyltransferase family glycosyltransferase [Streptomyces sp. 150FB]